MHSSAVPADRHILVLHITAGVRSLALGKIWRVTIGLDCINSWGGLDHSLVAACPDHVYLPSVLLTDPKRHCSKQRWRSLQ